MAITTKYWTRDQLIRKIELDLSLEDEDFVIPEEMFGYLEEAIDETEKLVHTLYEDYFLKKAPLALVSGQDEYALPEDIVGHKIRRIIYKNGSKAYPIKRLKPSKKFEYYTDGRMLSTSCDYQYLILNPTPGAPVISLTPVPNESGDFVTIWYLRQANRLEDSLDQLDIPEAAQFIIQFVKVRCYEKESHENLAKAMTDLGNYKTNLETFLASMVPDDDNELELDLSHYEEMN